MKSGIKYCLLLFLICVLGTTSTAQTNWQVKETIILINGEPTKVLLSNSGEILEVIEKLKNFSFTSKENPDRIIDDYIGSSENNLNTGPGQLIGSVNILFEENAATLSSDDIELLNLTAKELSKNPNKKLSIVASSVLAPVRLARNRANACKNYLNIKGINKDRIQIHLENTGSKIIEENNVSLVII